MQPPAARNLTPRAHANGNMTNDGMNTLGYDAESHAVSSSGSLGSGTYTYDGNGLRVKKTSIVNGNSTTTVYIFSGSKVIAEYDNGAAPSAPSREYVYGGSALLAKIDSSGTKYYHQDHLSNRLVTSSTGATLAQMGHFPFGESWYNSSSDKLLFTSYERDAESGNDYAQARYYVNRLARFLSLDPLSGSASDPQSLNRFTYVKADPINGTDPSGRMKCFANCPGWGAIMGGGGGGDGDDTTYIVDGLVMPNSMNSFFSQMLSVGLGFAQCPQNTCSFVASTTGQIVQFQAFAGLAGAVNGYYAISGVGSLSYTVNQAGIAAARWGIWYESQTGSEVGGSLWCGYGVFSSTLQQPGQPGASSVLLDFGFSDIPNGTDPAGWWRAEAGESPSKDLIKIATVNAQFGTSFSLFTGDYGDPGSPVLFYNKNVNSGYECVLVGPMPPRGYDAPCPK